MPRSSSRSSGASTLKRYAGHPLFVYAALATWFRHYDRSRPRFALRSEGIGGSPESVVDDAYFAICLNTHPYTYLGNRPLDVAPAAGLDSRLSLISFRTLAFAPTARVIVAAMRGRSGDQLARYRSVAYTDDVSEVTVTGYGPFPYQVDGDFLGEAERLTLRWEADALTLIMPAGAEARRADDRPGQ